MGIGVVVYDSVGVVFLEVIYGDYKGYIGVGVIIWFSKPNHDEGFVCWLDKYSAGGYGAGSKEEDLFLVVGDGCLSILKNNCLGIYGDRGEGWWYDFKGFMGWVWIIVKGLPVSESGFLD